jgi:cytidylate kinase
MRSDLITISREYGAGASELAALLGARLGWRVLDAEIPRVVASRLRIPDRSLDEWDEHAPGLLESLSNAFLLGSPELLIDPALAGRPEARHIAAATRDVLREAARTPPLIVVGHGAQVVFHDRPRTLHLRLVAPITDRVRRIVVRRSCTERDAVAIAHYVDRDRQKYVREFHGRDVRDPLLYTLQINTGVVEMDDAVRLVLTLLGEPTAR